jgi:membrane protein DedA with SNARE-associated domain
MLVDLINLFLGISSRTGYLGVLLLMLVESTVIPYPSEIIIPPAAYLAAQGQLNIFLVILFGTFGSVIGASINYFISYTLGRKLIYFLAGHKWARVIFINEAKIKKAEDMFLKNSRWATFIGRLIPGVRHLISIPAGFSRMPFMQFVLYTFSGAFIWVTILAILGYLFGSQQGLLMQYYRELTWLISVTAIIFILILWIRNRKNKKVSEFKITEPGP